MEPKSSLNHILDFNQPKITAIQLKEFIRINGHNNLWKMLDKTELQTKQTLFIEYFLKGNLDDNKTIIKMFIRNLKNTEFDQNVGKELMHRAIQNKFMAAELALNLRFNFDLEFYLKIVQYLKCQN